MKKKKMEMTGNKGDTGHVKSKVSVPISVTSNPGRTKGGSLLNVAH